MSEKRPIGSFANQVKRINEACISKADVYSVTKYDGFVRSLDYFKKQVFSRDLSSYKIVKRGEFAYSTIHLDEGALGLLGDEEALISPMYTTFEVDESVDKIYLSYLLKSPEMVSQYGLIGQGSVNRRKSVSFSSLAEIEVFTPTLPEQKKIAEILSGIDKSIQARQSSIHKTDSILMSMKEDLMTGVEEWQEYELGELLAFRNGLNTEKENFGQGVPFVSYKNVYSGGIVTTKTLTQSVSLSAVEEERFLLKSGDILFTRTSETPDEIGFSCVFDDRHGGAVFNGFCIRGRPLEGVKLTPKFASFYLRSESILSQMRFLCKYTTRAGISAESLSRVKVRIPDHKTQQKFADSLTAVKEYLATQEKSVQYLRDVKKTLSSELLSGRKRLSV